MISKPIAAPGSARRLIGLLSGVVGEPPEGRIEAAETALGGRAI